MANEPALSTLRRSCPPALLPDCYRGTCQSISNASDCKSSLQQRVPAMLALKELALPVVPTTCFWRKKIMLPWHGYFRPDEGEKGISRSSFVADMKKYHYIGWRCSRGVVLISSWRTHYRSLNLVLRQPRDPSTIGFRLGYAFFSVVSSRYGTLALWPISQDHCDRPNRLDTDEFMKLKTGMLLFGSFTARSAPRASAVSDSSRSDARVPLRQHVFFGQRHGFFDLSGSHFHPYLIFDCAIPSNGRSVAWLKSDNVLPRFHASIVNCPYGATSEIFS